METAFLRGESSSPGFGLLPSLVDSLISRRFPLHHQPHPVLSGILLCLHHCDDHVLDRESRPLVACFPASVVYLQDQSDRRFFLC